MAVIPGQGGSTGSHEVCHSCVLPFLCAAITLSNGILSLFDMVIGTSLPLSCGY